MDIPKSSTPNLDALFENPTIATPEAPVTKKRGRPPLKKRPGIGHQKLKRNEISPTEKDFIRRYTDPSSPTVLNASKSYKETYGCADSTANTAGSRMLDRPLVKQSIRELLENKGIDAKIAHNLDRLVSAAAEAPVDDWKAQKLGLGAGEFVRDVMGWKQPEQHLHVSLPPEDRDAEYAKLMEKIRAAQALPETKPE